MCNVSVILLRNGFLLRNRVCYFLDCLAKLLGNITKQIAAAKRFHCFSWMSQFSSEIAVKHSQYLWTAKWFFSSSLWIPGIQFLASKSSANTKIHIANNSSYHTPWRQEVTLVLTEDDLSSRLFFQQPSIFHKFTQFDNSLQIKKHFRSLRIFF